MISQNEFLLSVRETGYKGLEWALAELVDNSLESGATAVRIYLPGPNNPFGRDVIAVADDGCGMSKKEAMVAATFGGSSRYGSRSGMGRFGMGLPCSSLSQARRFDVVTRRDGRVRRVAVRFDLDDALAGGTCPVPFRPGSLASWPTGKGTVVVWSKLDRIDIRSWAHKAAVLRTFVSRKYRHHLLRGVEISVDNDVCLPFDPLLCVGWGTDEPCATPWGPILVLHLDGFDKPISVSFSLLRVADLAQLSAKEKKRRGIVGKAGVSIVRAGREIDYGWYFIDRRRENYDDWWRAEVAFDPEHDELFGVSYSKQGIRPTEALRVALSLHLTAASKQLQRLVREAHASLVLDTSLSRVTACAVTTESDDMLSPIASLSSPTGLRSTAVKRYSVEVRAVPSHRFVEVEFASGQVRVILNECHQFHDIIYGPASRGELSAAELSARLEAVLLAFARASLVVDRELAPHGRFLDEFSRNIKYFLRSFL
ncbi:MAG: ATP-binding protein [Armatimonadetes bacterium]|nr:ATP-binding protein [Armatimonadota bacterium]